MSDKLQFVVDWGREVRRSDKLKFIGHSKHGIAPWAFPYGATERAPESSGSIFRKRCLKSPGL